MTTPLEPFPALDKVQALHGRLKSSLNAAALYALDFATMHGQQFHVSVQLDAKGKVSISVAPESAQAWAVAHLAGKIPQQP